MSTILLYQKMAGGDFFELKRKNFELKKPEILEISGFFKISRVEGSHFEPFTGTLL
jgi:hypothetical protein